MNSKMKNGKNELVAAAASADIRLMIHEVHGVQVILDRDLAYLYGVTTGNLNKAVKRNLERFPEDFMFQLTKEEGLRFQIGTSKEGSGSLDEESDGLRFHNGSLDDGVGRREVDAKTPSGFLVFQSGISKDRRGGNRFAPYAFTENGIAMLSSVLHSERAIEVNIRIMREFVSMRKTLASLAPMLARIEATERRQIADQAKNDANQAKNEERFDELFSKFRGGEADVSHIFYQGKFWDAKSLLIKFVRRAKKELIVIDPYVGVATLDILAKRTRGVKIELITHSNGALADSDFEAFAKQYGHFTKTLSGTCHDRFIIVDGKEIFVIGASLKDTVCQTFSATRIGPELIPGLLDSLRKSAGECVEYGAAKPSKRR